MQDFFLKKIQTCAILNKIFTLEVSMALPVGLKEVTRELLVYSEDLVFPGSQKFAQSTEELRAYIPVYLKEHPNE